ncbi:unnamed protein product, partial [Coregonus sp. 'balchen']
MDNEFGDQFISLLDTEDLKDKDTIKVVDLDPPALITLNVQELNNSSTETSDERGSLGSRDTLILSSPESRYCPLQSCNIIQERRNSVIRGLIIYLGERVEDLTTEYKDANDTMTREDLVQHVMK